MSLLRFPSFGKLSGASTSGEASGSKKVGIVFLGEKPNTLDSSSNKGERPAGLCVVQLKKNMCSIFNISRQQT